MDLLELRKDRGMYALCLVETWHDAESVCMRRLRADGFQIVERSRPRVPSETSTLTTNHGGVAIVSVPGVRLSEIKLSVNPASFELLCAQVGAGSSTSVVVLIYRPGSKAVTSSFFDDLSDTLDCVIGRSDPIYVVGDLNVRLDRNDDASSRRLTELFDTYGLAVRPHAPTHACGGLLDVVASRVDLTPPAVTVYDAGRVCPITNCSNGQFPSAGHHHRSCQWFVVRGTG